MTLPAPAPGSGLAKQLRGSQFLSIGIGAIMGVGWAVVLGDWLTAAGPAGAVIGFLIGGLALLPVAACYAELATTLPLAGGEVVYMGEIFGAHAAFMVGWFLVLMAVAITGFEAISLAWFLDQLFPGHQGAVLYHVLGSEIHAGALVIGFIGVTAIALANFCGAHVSGRFQEIFTYLKTAAIALFVIAALTHGTLSHVGSPWPAAGVGHTIGGVLWIAVTTPLWLAGFQVVPQAIEERGSTTSLVTVGRLTVWAVILGIIFYCLVVTAATFAAPWPSIVKAPLPAAFAIQAALPNPVVARAVLLAVVLGILATWNSAFLWATRLLLALGRARLIPQAFAATGRFRSPTLAIVCVAILGLAGVCMGRGALLPIIGMASMSLAVSYTFTCAAALKMRRTQPQLGRPFRVPGGTATMIAALCVTLLMSLYGLLEPWLHSRGIPIEWVLLISWALIGAVLAARIPSVKR